jgi:2-amino-4-hydroxy-6-hydroxymethyldihydropteridine diphosphokinase
LTAGELAYVGLGANLGGPAGASPRQTLAAAIAALAALPQSSLQAASRVYLSDPVDSSGPPYYNQVVRLHSALPPQDLLARLQSIETEFGRERPYRNAPRTLDLDLLTWGDRQLNTTALTLPHPRMHQRLFVLMPMAELAPELVIAGHGTVKDCLTAVQATQTQRCTPLD